MEKLILNTGYLVLSNGTVKTHNWRNTGKTAILKPAKDKKGYHQVGLMVNGKLEIHRVHRLVAIAFIDNPDNKPMVNHINGIKTDNRVENLEWVTAKENTAHAIKNGMFSFQDSKKSVNILPKRGSLNGMALLNEIKVLEIRKKYKPRIYTRQMLAEEYNVKESCIKDVVNRKSWKHI